MKLFKKVAAAVLAGVMALSMVACANTPVTPVPDVPVDPTKPVEDQIFEMANNRLDLIKTLGATSNQKYVFPTLENELKADAQKVLDLIATGKAAYDTTDASVTSYTVDFLPASYDGKMMLLGGSAINVDNENGTEVPVVAYDAADATVAAAVKTLVTKMADYSENSEYKLMEEDTSKKSTVGSVTTTVYKADEKIGIASKVIDGETYVLIVWTAGDAQ